MPSAIHHRVSEEFKSSFQTESCYEETTGKERVLCIDDNVEALLWRLQVIETAQEEIVFSTFEMRDDNSGQDIMAALYIAAKRGVHIRILLDGLASYYRLHNNDHFKALVANENIEVKFYNPINLLQPWKISYRLHDKYLIADNSLYILGGRNTYDLFLGDYVDKINIDRDILVYQPDTETKGTSLAQLQTYFEEIWEMPYCKKVCYKKTSKKVKTASASLEEHYIWLQKTYPQAYKDTNYLQATIETNKVTLLANPKEPKNKEPKLWHMLQNLMIGANKVIIQTPYIICSKDMYQDLTNVCKNVENVELVTNAVESGANPFGCTDYLNQKNNVLKTGVSVYEFLGDNSTHVKTTLINNRLSIVGSYNLDMRSTYLDTEMMLAIDSTQLNAQLLSQVEQCKEKSKQVTVDGTIQYGSQYQPVNLTLKKKAFYAFVRTIIRPVRYLL